MVFNILTSRNVAFFKIKLSIVLSIFLTFVAIIQFFPAPGAKKFPLVFCDMLMHSFDC